MMSEFGSGVFLPPDATGVTVVTEIGTLTGVTPSGTMPPLLAAAMVRINVALLVPSFSAAGSERIVNVTPAGPRVPEDGVTVAHGLSVVALNETAGVCP